MTDSAKPLRIFGEPRPTYFVIREGGDAPHHRHTSRKWAIKEAERLSRKTPSVMFHVVKLKDTFLIPGDPRIGLPVHVLTVGDDPEINGAAGTIVGAWIDEFGDHLTVELPGLYRDGEAVTERHSFFANQIEITCLSADGIPIKQFDRVTVLPEYAPEGSRVHGRVLYVDEGVALVQIANQKPVEWHVSKLRHRIDAALAADEPDHSASATVESLIERRRVAQEKQPPKIDPEFGVGDIILYPSGQSRHRGVITSANHPVYCVKDEATGAMIKGLFYGHDLELVAMANDTLPPDSKEVPN